MKKPVITVAAALIAISALSPSSARAGDHGGAIAAGVIGGLAIGALTGAAMANSRPAPAYVVDEPTYVPVYRSARRVHVYHHYEAPDDPDDGYASGYYDGYRDAASDW
jgi:hypothetical protein